MVSDFAALRGKRIFLSGGTGFFGKWLMQGFLHFNQVFELGSEITVLSRDPGSFLNCWPVFKDKPGIRFIQGDVRSFSFPSGLYDMIIHAATEASLVLEQENPAEMYSVIMDGTRRVLDFAVQSGVRRFMFVSSGGVYGPQPVDLERIPESYTGCPLTAYGKGKQSAEQMCADIGSSHGFSVLLPRGFAFVGPYLNLDIQFAIGNFIRDCLENRPILIKGDGTSLRSYLYAEDLAEWLWAILLRGVHARPYNVGSDEAISIRDLAWLVRERAGTSNNIVVAGSAGAGARPARYVPDITRAREELGLRVCYPLPDAITRTVEWHRVQKRSL